MKSDGHLVGTGTRCPHGRPLGARPHLRRNALDLFGSTSGEALLHGIDPRNRRGSTAVP